MPAALDHQARVARRSALAAGKDPPAWAAELEPITQLPWEVAVWARRKPGRVVARDGRDDVLLIDGELRLRFPTLTAACAAVAL